MFETYHMVLITDLYSNPLFSSQPRVCCFLRYIIFHHLPRLYAFRDVDELRLAYRERRAAKTIVLEQRCLDQNHGLKRSDEPREAVSSRRLVGSRRRSEAMMFIVLHVHHIRPEFPQSSKLNTRCPSNLTSTRLYLPTTASSSLFCNPPP